MKVYLLSRLEAFTAANTRVFRVSPAMGMARCWMYEESLKTQHYRLGPCTSQHINHRYKTFLFEGLHKNSLKPFLFCLLINLVTLIILLLSILKPRISMFRDLLCFAINNSLTTQYVIILKNSVFSIS